MSRDRVSKKAGWAKYDQLPKGPGGRRLCRWCSKEVPKGRRTFCGDECVHEHKLRSDPRYVRTKLFERDAGICASCQADTEALRHELRKALRTIPWGKLRDDAAANCGIPEQFRGLDTTRSWWEADHIVPVVEGGGECGLEGYRTLCIPCHKQVTRELRKRLARRRQDGPEATKTATPGSEAAPAGPNASTALPGHAGAIPETGLRHDGVPAVRRSGRDHPVQDHVPAVRDRGDV